MKISPYLLSLLLIMALPCHAAEKAATPAPKPSPQEELQIHRMGTLIGYVNYCLKKSGMKDLKNPEDKPFAEHYGAPIKKIGIKGVQLFQEGLKKGVFNASQENGSKCGQRLNQLIKLYKDIDLEGTLYTRALKKYQ